MAQSESEQSISDIQSPTDPMVPLIENTDSVPPGHNENTQQGNVTRQCDISNLVILVLAKF